MDQPWHGGCQVIYISYAEMVRDVHNWSEQLPEYDLIIGVPRSGLMVASILALRRNIPLAIGDEILQGGQRQRLRKLRRALIVDDSALSGRSLKVSSIFTMQGMQVDRGALYIKPGLPFLHYRKIPLPRIFEWNVFHSYWMERACVDIDGVLCRDPTQEENDDGPRYEKFLTTVKPRLIPTVKIAKLVTSRLEKYRKHTVAWLDRYNVKYGELVMHPAVDKMKRLAMGDHAQRKAAAFTTSLFIESSLRQAKVIASLTLKPVLCIETNALL